MRSLFLNEWLFCPNDRIFHCLYIPQNSPNEEYTSHLPKNVIVYCRPRIPPLGAAISTSSLNCAECHDIGHAHFHPPIFSANSRNVANLLFRTSPRKLVKRILIFQTILKLLNNNLLYILLKTQSVAYLHIGVSQWHETQVTTSPWATKALWKNINLLFPTPLGPFDPFKTNFASSIYGQHLSKPFTYVTPGGAVHFDASP